MWTNIQVSQQPDNNGFQFDSEFIEISTLYSKLKNLFANSYKTLIDTNLQFSFDSHPHYWATPFRRLDLDLNLKSAASSM